MRVYRLSTRLKLGLVLFAVLIAVSSLFYTNRLANRLQERELENLQQWSSALELRVGSLASPYTNTGEFQDLKNLVDDHSASGELSAERAASLLDAINWAESMPPSELILFLDDLNARFLESSSLPVVITDTTGSITVPPLNVSIDSTLTEEGRSAQLRNIVADLDRLNDPLRIEISIPGVPPLVWLAHFGEPATVTQLRWFPYIQLVFVFLFIMIGYVGFSYVRRQEQSHLWVGMAKEAAHQLGTPTSSLMGWSALLRSEKSVSVSDLYIPDELDRDVARLQRVANRFSRIGSKPALTTEPIGDVIRAVTEYIRPRMPRGESRDLRLSVTIHEEVHAPLDTGLFEWVLENLLKNALDAIARDGSITISLSRVEKTAVILVSDTGKGIDRRSQANIFKPGYSTKPRGWGLGLSLSKRIVEEYHNGSLTLESSRTGEGTSFKIVLPAEPGLVIRSPGLMRQYWNRYRR